MKDITRALAFISHQYKNIVSDRTESPYTHHLIVVLDELVQAGVTDHSTLTAAVLHDIRHYSSVTHEQILAEFGKEVADLTNELYYELNTPKPELQIYLLERIFDLSDKAKQIVTADLIANTSDYFYEKEGSELAQRARLAWARALVNEINRPQDRLTSRFNEVMTALCDRNGYDQNDDWIGFLDDDDRMRYLMWLEAQMALLRSELAMAVDEVGKDVTA